MEATLRDYIWGNGPVESMKVIYEIERDAWKKARDQKNEKLMEYHGGRMDIAHKAWITLQDYEEKYPLII